MNANQDVAHQGYVKKLLILFGLFYFAQAVAQQGGITALPVSLFFKVTMGWSPAQVEIYTWSLIIPWSIKPLYGMLSDYVPVLGYRRKSWLLLANLLAGFGFLSLAGYGNEPSLVFWGLCMTAVGTAAADVIVDALMVENGKKYDVTAKLQSIQWFWFFVANIATSLAGGYLCRYFEAETSATGAITALQIAATIAVAGPLAVLVATWLIVKEEPQKLDLNHFKQTTGGIWSALKTWPLYAAFLFLAVSNLSPNLGTPWDYYTLDVLKFKSDQLGWLGACGGVGAAFGAWIYSRHVSKFGIKKQLLLAITVSVVATLSHVLLVTPHAYTFHLAVVLAAAWGMGGAMVLLATLTLAAQCCPSNAEGFTFAILMSARNLSLKYGSVSGAWLHENKLDKNIVSLILLSAACTAVCYLLVPLMRTAQNSGK